MSVIGLARGLTGLALPSALAVAWWRRRNEAGRQPGPPGEGSSPAASRRAAPGRRQMKTLIGDGSDLSKLDLRGVSLNRSDLRGRSFTGSDLSRARLARADLRDADLAETTLDFADLSRCDLRRANLTGASLLETTMVEADLRGADLSRCRNLIMANMRRARYDTTTRWPGQLDARTLGASLERSGNDSA